MYNKAKLFLILPVFIAGGLLNAASGQNLPGKRDSINSTVLGEKRIIQVVLPEKYKPGSTDKYDVLYVLDGEGNTKTMTDVQHFLEGEGAIPSTIIVGVLNTDRNRDFLPTHVADTKTSGGADKFLSFFKNELIPYIDKTYPSDGDNTLFGHSFGGVFVTYALLNEPQLFKSYIAADPSYWWDKGVMRMQVKEKLPGLTNLNKTFFITGREGQALTGMGIPPMDTILKAIAPVGLNWKLSAYPNETHGTVRLKSMYDGLKFTYAGYSTKPIAFHPMSGLLLKDKPIKIWYFDDTAKLRYTTDGAEPTMASAKMAPEITISAPGKLTVKQFASRDRYSKITTGEFRIGSPAPVSLKPKNVKPGGFHYNYYEGQWDKIPDFKSLKPVKSGIADTSFDINKFPRQENFALLIDGQIKIEEDGYYIFGLDSDDGSKLYLNNQLLIDYDGLHGSGDDKSYILPLQKGFYPIRIEYFQKEGGRELKLIYLTPSLINGHPQPIAIPLALQYSHN
jgi:predicted alpha/beta superfamily hydrolase